MTSTVQEKILLSVRDLRANFHIDRKVIKAVDGIDFDVHRNEIVGIVGESGSGKSVSALSILRLLPSPPCRITGRLLFNGSDLLETSERQMQRIRGNDISIIFQEPMTSLNPVLTIGDQISESIRLHQHLGRRAAWDKAISLLDLVKMPDPHRRVHDYPHQLSGGMKQRVMIAMAMSSNPLLLIADEPTTALDVTIQKQILFLIKDLQKNMGTSVLFITHNLGVIAEIADTVIVLYAGRIMENAPVRELYHHPRHPYSLFLMRSIPRLDFPRSAALEVIPGRIPAASSWPKGCVFHPRCALALDRCRVQEPPLMPVGAGHWSRCWRHEELAGDVDKKRKKGSDARLGSRKSPGDLLTVRKLSKHFRIRSGALGLRSQYIKAVDGVNLSIKEGEVLGLVGESGCGKSTLGLCILRLIEPTAGEIRFGEQDASKLNYRDLTRLRREMQVIFQDPYGSINPRMKTGEIIGESLMVHRLTKDADDRKRKSLEILEMVGLDGSFLMKYPHELSGGQRQRVAIARALAVSPRLIVCDEPVSALDVSIQAQIINLLEDLKEKANLTYLFISHDLSVVKHISDRIAILYLGKIIELAGSERICSRPKHPYTMSLIASVPIPDPNLRSVHINLKDEIPSPIDIPRGCRFHPRCSFAQTKCTQETPELRELEPEWLVACHRVEEIEQTLLSPSGREEA